MFGGYAFGTIPFGADIFVTIVVRTLTGVARVQLTVSKSTTGMSYIINPHQESRSTDPRYLDVLIEKPRLSRVETNF